MPEVIVYSFQFLDSKLSGLPVLSRLCFSPLAVLGDLDPASVISVYSFIFNSTWEAFVSQLRTFFYIPHLLGLLPKCSKFPGVLSGLFTSFGLTISRTFYTNFRLAILLVKTVRRSNTCLIKDLARTTTYSEKDGSRGRWRIQTGCCKKYLPIPCLMLNFVLVYSCENTSQNINFKQFVPILRNSWKRYVVSIWVLLNISFSHKFQSY